MSRLFLEHALLVADLMVAVELACAQSQKVRLIQEEELAVSLNVRDPFRWMVNIGSNRLGLRPDSVFGLENTRTGERAFYFLEADRATMPVSRRNLTQTSFRRKLLAYEATWEQNVHRTRFGFHRFRVLTVTSTPARVATLTQAVSSLEHARGLFLFADTKSFREHEDLFAMPWHTHREGQTASLLD